MSTSFFLRHLFAALVLAVSAVAQAHSVLGSAVDKSMSLRLAPRAEHRRSSGDRDLVKRFLAHQTRLAAATVHGM